MRNAVLIWLALAVAACNGKPSGTGDVADALDLRLDIPSDRGVPDRSADTEVVDACEIDVPEEEVEIVEPDVHCVPDCDGKECGPDGCEGECGPCPAGWNCTPVGKCAEPCFNEGGGPFHVWSASFGGEKWERATALAARPLGGLYLAARTGSDLVDFGSGPLVGMACDNPNSCGDMVLARFDDEGQPVWSKRYGGGGLEQVTALSVRDDTIYAAGSFSSAKLDLDGDVMAGHGFQDAFIMKMSIAGDVAWSLAIGGEFEDSGTAIDVDEAGNIYLLGWFESPSIEIGGQVLETMDDECALTECGDLFLAKLDPDGQVLWTQRFGGNAGERPVMLRLAENGGLYLAGSYGSWQLNFGGTALELQETICGPMFGCSDLFVAQLDPDGNHIWSRSFGGDHLDVFTAAGSGSGSSVWLAGYYSSSLIDWGGESPMVNSTGLDNFVVGLDSEGEHIWSHHLEAPPHALVPASQGNGYLAGSFAGAVLNLGGCDLYRVGQQDAFVVGLDSGGAHAWSVGYGSDGMADAAVVAASAAGVYVAGHFSGGVPDFGGGEPLPQFGADDLFLLHLAD